jgi:hypothetical protein
MEAILIKDNNTNTLKENLLNLTLQTDVKSVLIFLADEDHPTGEVLDPILQKAQIPIIGGVFPELIYSGNRYSKGILLLPLPMVIKTQLFDLSKNEEDYLRQLEREQKATLEKSSTLFVFTDALSPNKERFIESLFNFFGINTVYFGGGAGSLKFKSFHCIIDNQGMHINSAVIGLVNKKIALGVAHGWHAISEPLKVTKTDKYKIEGINWKPAFEVYAKIVESHSGRKFTKNNFFEIAKSYPLGVTKIDDEMIVRDPIMVTNNTIHTVDIVNEGEYVKILHGNMDSLLTGAKSAKDIAVARADKEILQNPFFCIDCISRVLFMQDAFKKELDVIGQDRVVNGILTIGEIANSGESFLEIYNKANAVAIW